MMGRGTVANICRCLCTHADTALLAEPAEDAAAERGTEREHVAVQGAQDEGRLPPPQHVLRRRAPRLLRRRVLGRDQVHRPNQRRHSRERCESR